MSAVVVGLRVKLEALAHTIRFVQVQTALWYLMHQNYITSLVYVNSESDRQVLQSIDSPSTCFIVPAGT